jgi:cephalosporin hydroxylase
LAQEEGEYVASFLGIQLLQFPNDLMTYQGLLFESKPEVVVEVGTNHGGLTLYLAMLLENISESSKVVSIDLNDCTPVLLTPGLRQSLKDKIRFIQGNSIGPETCGAVASAIEGKTTFVILDSLHEYGHVLKELELYSRFVSPGGYLVVNDTHLEGPPWLPPGDPGPLEAVRSFLTHHPQWELITPKPNFAVSCFHDGILRRKG